MLIVNSKDEFNDFGQILERYQAALERLRGWGVAIAPNSRLMAYEARLVEADRVAPGLVTEEFTHQFIVDLREIDEIITIASSFPSPPTLAELELLRRLVGGAEHPDDERGSPPREAQFELVVRSLLGDRGVELLVGNPDLTITYKGESYPLEAKRPGSERRFDDRLREASSQISLRGKPGIVAISMDEVLRPHGAFLVMKKREALGFAINQLIREYVERHKRAIAQRVAGKNVACILLTATLPAKDQDTSLSLLGANHHLEVIAEDGSPGSALVECMLLAFEGQ